MKKLLDLGNRYAQQSDWTDFALTKFCLCAMGLLIGLQIPGKHRRAVRDGAIAVFTATYIPLMCKLFSVAKDMRTEGDAEQPMS